MEGLSLRRTKDLKVINKSSGVQLHVMLITQSETHCHEDMTRVQGGRNATGQARVPDILNKFTALINPHRCNIILFCLKSFVMQLLINACSTDVILDVTGWQECRGVGISCAYIPYHIKGPNGLWFKYWVI